MPEPRDMTDQELDHAYRDSSRSTSDSAVNALLREIRRRSDPGPVSRKFEPWTTSDNADLLRLVDEGIDVTAIAVRLGRTEEAVRVRIARLKARRLV